jgi:hypothetical protein
VQAPSEPEPEREIPHAPLAAITMLVRTLIADFRAWIDAERDVIRLRAALAGRSAAWIAAFVVGALVLAQAAMVGLVVGLLFMLAPMFGMGLATLAVTGGAVLIIAVLLWLAKRRAAAFMGPKDSIS